MKMDGFRFNNKQDLFDLLQVDQETIEDAIKNKSKAYIKYAKKKKDGYRTIYSINQSHPIYLMQKRLKANFFNVILFPECVFGFIKNRSYYDFLKPHCSDKEKYFLRLDISNFFDSMQISDFKDALNYYISKNDDITSEDIIWIVDTICDITAFQEHFIQGAVTSPDISNIVFRSLDIRIERYCQKLNITYTRYADDLLFSSESDYIHKKMFLNRIKHIIKDKGFELNHNKTLKYRSEIALNGYVVGKDIRLSRSKLNSLNKIIFKMNSKSFKGFSTEWTQKLVRNKLAGYRAFLIQSIRYTDDNIITNKIQNKIIRIERLINKYCI